MGPVGDTSFMGAVVFVHMETRSPSGFITVRFGKPGSLQLKICDDGMIWWNINRNTEEIYMEINGNIYMCVYIYIYLQKYVRNTYIYIVNFHFVKLPFPELVAKQHGLCCLIKWFIHCNCPCGLSQEMDVSIACILCSFWHIYIPIIYIYYHILIYQYIYILNNIHSYVNRCMTLWHLVTWLITASSKIKASPACSCCAATAASLTSTKNSQNVPCSIYIYICSPPPPRPMFWHCGEGDKTNTTKTCACNFKCWK